MTEYERKIKIEELNNLMKWKYKRGIGIIHISEVIKDTVSKILRMVELRNELGLNK